MSRNQSIAHGVVRQLALIGPGYLAAGRQLYAQRQDSMLVRTPCGRNSRPVSLTSPAKVTWSVAMTRPPIVVSVLGGVGAGRG